MKTREKKQLYAVLVAKFSRETRTHKDTPFMRRRRKVRLSDKSTSCDLRSADRCPTFRDFLRCFVRVRAHFGVTVIVEVSRRRRTTNEGTMQCV